MTFQTPLQSADYTKLRGTAGNNSWWGNQFITLCKNTLVFAARVNGAISSSSFAAIAFDTVTTGAYTDVEIGETFFLSHTSDIRAAYYRGRIRLDADSSHIYVNETSVNITDNDYIFVVYDFDVWDRLSRMVGTTQYWDFDEAFHPLAPVACGLQTAYTNYDPSDGVYHINFDVSSSYAADEGSSDILTYQFTFVAGTYTVTSGALNTAIVGVDFNANTEQWGKLVVTDSQGTTWTRRFYIRAHGLSDPPSLDFTGVQITGSLDSGWNATVTAWAGVQSVLDQTFCVVWCQEYYNGVLGPLSIANNIDMVGRFHREDNNGHGDPLYSYVANVKFDIEGIATQMQRLEEQDLTTINTGLATAVDQISFNTPQRSIVYYSATHSTLLSLCDLTFPDGFDLTYLFSYFPNQGGNVLDAIKGIAAQINANVEFAPDGRIQVVRDTRFLVDKSGVVVVGDFDNRDFTSTDLPVDPVNKTGRLDAYGAALVSGNIEADRTRAPGAAQGYAAGESTLDAQILASATSAAVQAELNYRAGQQMAIENLTYSQDWQAPNGGYHFLIPSRGQRVTHTLTTATNVRGLSFGVTDYWQVVSITINHDNEKGSRTVSTHEELEPPTGDSGDTVPQIAGGTQTNPILLQPLDPFPALPDDPGNYLPDNPTPNPYPPLIPPKNGNTVIYATDSLIDTSRSVIAYASPVWTGVTPAGLGAFQIKDVCFDLTTPTAPIGAYILASDGTSSAIWYTSDVFSKPTVWTEGTTFDGVYNQIRSAGTPGSVLVYAASGAGSVTTTTYDFTASNGGWTGQNHAAYSAGVGWVLQADDSGVFLGISSATLVGFDVYYFTTGFSTPGFNGLRGGNGTAVIISPAVVAGGSLTHFVGSVSSTTEANVRLGGVGPDNGGAGSATVTKIVLKTTTSGSAVVRYSPDYGATVGSGVTVGTLPGDDGGFDLERIGGASLAAAAGQVMIATTLGGSYSNAMGGTLSAGQPVSLVIPYRRLPHGAVQYSATDPDYILGSSAIISSSCLWDVDGTSGTLTNINPVAGATCVGANLLTVWQSAAIRKIAVVVSVSGVYKVYVFNGSTWAFSRNVTTPVFLRCRRNDPNGTQLFLIDGSTLYVSTDWGVTWRTRTTPSSSNGVSMDIFY